MDILTNLQGLIGIVIIIAAVILFSNARRQINWRTIGVGLALQIAFAFLVLKWEPGFAVLKWLSGGVEQLITFTNKGTEFVFGGLMDEDNIGFTFALNVLPVIIFIGAIVGALFHLRILQYIVWFFGTGISKLLGTSKIESVWAASSVFLGMSESPLLVKPWIPKLTRSELFTCLTTGFATVSGSTLLGYSLLGAPLPYLLAASVMNAPGAIILAKALVPETEVSTASAEIRSVRDTENTNVIDALGSGAMTGGRVAISVGCLMIAFVATIALLSGLIGGLGNIIGQDNWSLEGLFGFIFSPMAWAIGVPWDEASLVGNFIGQKTILNEFVGYTAFSEHVDVLSEKSIMLSTFALAGFANFSSIAIQIGALGALVPERRAEVAQIGLKSMFAGLGTNLLNAAIVGLLLF